MVDLNLNEPVFYISSNDQTREDVICIIAYLIGESFDHAYIWYTYVFACVCVSGYDISKLRLK